MTATAPKKPSMDAIARRSPTFSPSSGTLNAVTNKGVVKNKAVTVASGRIVSEIKSEIDRNYADDSTHQVQFHALGFKFQAELWENERKHHHRTDYATYEYGLC